MDGLGYQVFSRSAFPLNQDGFIRFGYLPDDFKNFEDFRVLADNVGEGILFTDFFPEMVQLSLHFLGFESLADDG